MELGMQQYCTVLYCTTLHYTALNCVALCCTILHCTALHCTVLHCKPPRCNVQFLNRTRVQCSLDVRGHATVGKVQVGCGVGFTALH